VEPIVSNPYASKPDYAFWRRGVSGRGAKDVDPVVHAPFTLRSQDAIATAGSCFAQHISHALREFGLRYLVTESGPRSAGAIDENYGVFPARFGNIYTVRQLRQLFERAYGVFEPVDSEWIGHTGHYIDPFRPRVQGGFFTWEALRADREAHLQAVQEMFESCDVFIFTLGLTEAWVSRVDGAVFPLAPGVVSRHAGESDYRFHNFTVGEMEADMRVFIDAFRRLNPGVRIILTVSPVALAATFEDRHIVVSNAYSKAALRVVAESITASTPGVVYFPSYEIITGSFTRSVFFSDDLRDVTPEGVAHVMSIFRKHFLTTAHDEGTRERIAPGMTVNNAVNPQEARMREIQSVICDEDIIEATP
jgi:hypothetical protein